MTVPVTIPSGGTELSGDLVVPADAVGAVVFAHGSGSSRFSSRNRAVARSLQDRRLATLLFDLLDENEDRYDRQTARHRFDIDMLTPRLVRALEHVAGHAATAGLPIAAFGASTGAAVALRAAAQRPDLVRAVVSRGGRPDLAGDDLANVRAPTLLLVGERDPEVITLNQQAATQLSAEHELRVVPGATHLFEEAGALEQVADHAGEWFERHLAGE
ncbi:dienelactone hydrolase family protein [Haloechinothrix salitolerans]|uniref:Dienelactone hydrolase family protein n=1 Tax=Haloechinothrix salitolerans TaxID=926830 RepID=A0ABW2C0R1_9PSEU